MAISLLILSSTISAVETFQTYHNSRFDYSIDYPANLLILKAKPPMAMVRYLPLRIMKPA
jgi:hypothetical protein